MNLFGLSFILYFFKLSHGSSFFKGNKTMKFDLLIQYNMRNTFLEKSYTKCGEQARPTPFSEKL